ncbi:MAG: DUF4124 domain-containing protein [Proteobacteria bacterium]|nr:DUF4124 domain-containing protein [Pseudomonadota bacterium]
MLSILSFSLHAVEFHSCTDNNGQTHFTNLPLTSLNSNCTPKDYYSEILNQDYQNLSNEYAKYDNHSEKEGDDTSELFEIGKIDISSGTLSNKVQDIFDPDKALQELMESTENRDDAFTRAMRGRAKGIQSIIDQENIKKP